MRWAIIATMRTPTHPHSPLSTPYSEGLNLALHLHLRSHFPNHLCSHLHLRWHLHLHSRLPNHLRSHFPNHLCSHLHLRWHLHLHSRLPNHLRSHLHPHNRVGANGTVKSLSLGHRSHQGRLGETPSQSTRSARFADRVNTRKAAFAPFLIALIVSLRIMDHLIAKNHGQRAGLHLSRAEARTWAEARVSFTTLI